MTHHRFVTRATSESIHGNEEELVKDRKLIILLECVKYCTKNKIGRIRYGQLKNLSNDKLANLTNGKDTDMGGSFEKYIVEFESSEDPDNRLVERLKIKHKKSYIVPNIQKIRNFFANRNLINLIDGDPTSFKAVKVRNSEEGKLSSFRVMGEIPADKNKIPVLKKRKLFSVSYYYENGKPVFVEDHNMQEKDPAPFYEEDNFMSSSGAGERMHFDKDMTMSPALVTDPWSIHLIRPKGKSILVNEKNLKRLLSLGKSIVSNDPDTHLGIAIEYDPHITG